jgi:tetratricopeptide (TPR) repeat protein
MNPNLLTALQFHRQGHVELAASAYRGILAGFPDDPDALHLLGVLAHQLGNHSRAAELIGRAILLRPAAAVFHNNLAEVYRALGQLEQAVLCCRAVLRLQPQNPDAINCLGLVLLSQNQPEAAAGHFREALRLRPGFALACNNWGNALRLSGDTEGALDHFRRAVAIDPNLAEAHSNLGQLLLERKELEGALAHCREAVRLRPNLAEGHNNLGNVLREMHRLPEAREKYAEALRLCPALGMAYNNMAQALQEEGNLEEALTWYKEALLREPNSARIHTNLASALVELEKTDEAIARYELALRLDPDYAEAHNGLGWVRQEQGRYEEARELYGEAVRRKPDLAAAHCNLGSVLEELSDFAGAESSLRAALRLDARLAGAQAQLATMLRRKLPQADLDHMRRLLDDPYLTLGQRGCLHFGLAQALDAREAYIEAAEHLREANGIALSEWAKRGRSYDPVAHAEHIEKLCAAFTPEIFVRMRGLGSESERPIFIVGLPRSGTTLTEQILAAHSHVFAAGELRFGHDDFEALSEEASSSSFETLSRLDGATVRRVAQCHLDRLQELNEHLPRIADKLPDNYLHLGLLAVLFPRARFIHCRRDLRDVAVSCWMTNFRHIRWASDPEHIAARFRAYERLMEHWRKVLPVSVLEVDYEETVADVEGVARRLVSWCGLEWEPACLAYHEVKRPVRTASVSQVRQPIYTRSVARWRHYEPALGPLFARLVAEPSEGRDRDPSEIIGPCG